MKIKILYEDLNILAIEKPSGIAVHADGRSREKTIADWFLKNYPKAKNVGEPALVDGVEIKRPGIVHRLDKETSGVLLLAKNQKTYEFLKNQFQERTVKKIYNAVVSGFLKNDHDIINKSIGRSPKDFRRRLAGRGAKGELKNAITEYIVLKRFELVPALVKFSSLRPQAGPSGAKISQVLPQKFSYLEVRPKTGRTHQIRVHMKYINHPVVCDSLYNPDGVCPKQFKRLALHAKSIEFKDLKGNTIKVESLLPKEFKEIIAKNNLLC